MIRPFLTARWEDLVLLNYVCPPDILAPLVPQGTSLDFCHGEVLVSLVGFMFKDTCLLGQPIPFHRTFEEVNLRFYVRRTTTDGDVRRAVVFVRELVPRRAIAAIARCVYNEPYIAVPMSHESSLAKENGGSASYSWSYRGEPFELKATAFGPSAWPEPGSEAEFITEHYWGYTRQKNGETLEYQVEHPTWHVWDAASARFSGRGDLLYGSAFGSVLSPSPRSAFVALGSQVAVQRGRRLDRVR